MEPRLGNENGETAENTAEEKEVPHLTHSFQWQIGGKVTSVTCNKAGTVEDVLKRSSQFRRIAEKNKNKQLVIVKKGKAIASHCPCSLIKAESLTLKYVKAVQKQQGSGSVHSHRKRPSGDLLMFHVRTKGGKNVVKIMKNRALNTVVQEITVYAYKGEKVKHALRRDGRFQNKIFKKNCVLSHTSTEVNTEMANLVDNLDGETYKIILLDKSSPPESLDDAYLTQNESQRSDNDENQDPQQSATIESVNDNASTKKRGLSDNVPRRIQYEMPHSKMLQAQLSSQFKHSMERIKTGASQPPPVLNLMCVEFGRNLMRTEVKTMKNLMRLSSYVCQVRINGSAMGSGFLLFDKFVLTNAHVLKDVYNENSRLLDKRVTVHFSFESLDQTEKGQESGTVMEVEEVTGFEYNLDASGHMYDWALLRLSGDRKLSGVLLTEFGFIPPSGGIHIVGHPAGAVKNIESCVIIPSCERLQVMHKRYNGNHFQYIASSFFQAPVLTYDSCFYSGSSGSPVFDNYCRVVAMHSGGYTHKDEIGKEHHTIEFGYPLSLIMEHVIVQMVEKQRLDVLKAYLLCNYPHHEIMMTNVKKLVESRNIVAFKNAVNNLVTTNDESLKMFFEFICKEENPVPMDIDGGQEEA